ncbi:hypothetical protein ACFFJN_12580 [Erwinia mallotivora]|uniref:hypothetical protein n=1 Tax=Erwinia mallotivora TaxID=69222 RepID=UPI0035EBE74F
MIDSVNKKNASCIITLLDKIEKHGKVKTSHLNKCLKNVTRSHVEIGRKDRKNMMENLDFIEHMLRDQGSRVYEKKQAIIDKIVSRALPGRERYIASELARDAFAANNKKDHNPSGPERRFSDVSYASVIHDYNDGINNPNGHSIKQKFIGELKYKVKHQSPGNVNNIEGLINERKSVLLKENSRPLTEMERKLAQNREKIAELAPTEREIENKKNSQSESLNPFPDECIYASVGQEKYIKEIIETPVEYATVNIEHRLKKRCNKITLELNNIREALRELEGLSSYSFKNNNIRNLFSDVDYTRNLINDIHSISLRLFDSNSENEVIKN